MPASNGHLPTAVFAGTLLAVFLSGCAMLLLAGRQIASQAEQLGGETADSHRDGGF